MVFVHRRRSNHPDNLHTRDTSRSNGLNRYSERAIPSRKSAFGMVGPLAVAKLSSGIGSVFKSEQHDHGTHSSGQATSEVPSSGGRSRFGKGSLRTLAAQAGQRAAAKLSHPSSSAGGLHEPYPRTAAYSHFSERAIPSRKTVLKLAPQVAAAKALTSGRRLGHSGRTLFETAYFKAMAGSAGPTTTAKSSHPAQAGELHGPYLKTARYNYLAERAIPSRKSVLKMTPQIAAAKALASGKKLGDSGKAMFQAAIFNAVAGPAAHVAAGKGSRPAPAQEFHEPYPRTFNEPYSRASNNPSPRTAPVNRFAKRADFFNSVPKMAAAKLAGMMSGIKSGAPGGSASGKSSLVSNLVAKAGKMAAAKFSGQAPGKGMSPQGPGAAGEVGQKASGLKSKLGAGALLAMAGELAISHLAKQHSDKPSTHGSSYPGPFDHPHQQQFGNQHASMGFQHSSGYQQQSGFQQYSGHQPQPGLQPHQPYPGYQMHSGAPPGHDPYFPFPQKRSIVQTVPEAAKPQSQLPASEQCVPCSDSEYKPTRAANHPKALLAKRTIAEEPSTPLGSPQSNRPIRAGSSRATSLEASSSVSAGSMGGEGAELPSSRILTPMEHARKTMDLYRKVSPLNKLPEGDSRPIRRQLSPRMSQVFASNALSGGTLLVLISNSFLYFAHYPEKAQDRRNNFESPTRFNDVIISPLRRDMGMIQRNLSPDERGAEALAVILSPTLTSATISHERYPNASKEIKDFIDNSLPQAERITKSYRVVPKLTDAEVTADKVIIHWNTKDSRNGTPGSSATVYYNNQPVHSKFWPGKVQMRCCGLFGKS